MVYPQQPQQRPARQGPRGAPSRYGGQGVGSAQPGYGMGMPGGVARPKQQRRPPDLSLLRRFTMPGPQTGKRPPASPVSSMYPSTTSFSQTPAGNSILQRVLKQYAGRRNMGRR